MRAFVRSSAMLLSGFMLAIGAYAFTQDGPAGDDTRLAPPPPPTSYTNPVAPDYPSVMITQFDVELIGAIQSEMIMTGHDGDYVVFDYSHSVAMVSSVGGTGSALKDFGPFTVVIPFDDGGVRMYQAMLQEKIVTNLVVTFYRGSLSTPVQYMQVTLQNALITSIESVDGAAASAGYNPARQLLKVSFAYNQISWEGINSFYADSPSAPLGAPVLPRADGTKPVDGGEPADSAAGVVEKD